MAHFNKQARITEIPIDILKKINKNNIVKRYAMVLLSLIISALLFNLFIVPTNIVTGGINGISIILKNLYGFTPSIVIIISSIILLIFSFIYLGIERTSFSLFAAFFYPFLVEITSNITNYLTIATDDLLLISIFIGVIGGFANGLMYKTGFSNCGLPIICQILYEKLKIPYSRSSLAINGIIVLIGGYFFGFTMVMYAILILYINNFMLDKVILGISKNKAFYILTKEDELVRKYIIEKLNHNVTIFDVKGGFLQKKKNILMTVIPTRDYFMVTAAVKEIDPDAFFVACDAYEVKGGR